MDTVIGIPLAAAGIGALLWFLVSRRKRRTAGPETPKARIAPGVLPMERTPGASVRRFPRIGSNFEAVSIQISHHPCHAARNLRGKRFLPDEMPDLPLPECDRKCHCTFIHHPDRRDGENRRAPYLSVDHVDDDQELSEYRKGADRRSK